jgi:isoleucyl-tRNA synthetase
LTEEDSFDVLCTLLGSDIIGTTYTHPLYERNSPVLEGGDYITTESGTGLVHTAPGHGQEDYITGLKYGLDLLSPVDDAGKFTIEAGERFSGMSVLAEGNQAIVDALTEVGALLKAEDYGHKYPYDWRTKKLTIFRATDQWFASVAEFRDAALEAVDKVSVVYRGTCTVRMKSTSNYPEGLNATSLLPDATFETELFNPDTSHQI